MRMSLMRAAAIVLAAGTIAPLAQAQIRVVFSNIATDPSSDIPNSGGLKFDNGVSTQFDRPFVSADGNRFLLVASFDVGTGETDNEIIIAGTLNPLTANIVVREGLPTPFDPTINYGTFLRTQADINNDGSFAFSADTTGATTADEVYVKFDALTNTWTARREGSPHPFTTPLPSPNWGGAISDANILADGRVAGRASTFTGTGGAAKQILWLESAILGETDVTIPAGQLITPTQTLDAWTTTDRFRMSDDGTKWIARGDLNGPTATDDFIMISGTIVAHEGAPLLGSPPNVGVVSGDGGSNLISHNGNHTVYRLALADGSGATATDVVVHDGVIVARTDALITNQPGEDEAWDDATFSTTFFLNAINNQGDYVVGGTTNNVDATANAVLVLNGERVVVRENDPVDLNGDGLPNDNVRIATFNNDDCFLTDDLKLYFQADLRDDTGSSIASQALLFIDLGGAPVACDDIDFNNNGVFPEDQDTVDFFDVLAGGSPATCDPIEGCNDIDFNNNGVFPEDQDVIDFFNVLAGGTCPL
jgi:hypothetical protein